MFSDFEEKIGHKYLIFMIPARFIAKINFQIQSGILNVKYYNMSIS